MMGLEKDETISEQPRSQQRSCIARTLHMLPNNHRTNEQTKGLKNAKTAGHIAVLPLDPQSASMHLISTSRLLSLMSSSLPSFSNHATSLNIPNGRSTSLFKLFSRLIPTRLVCSHFSAASSALSITPGGIPHILAQCMP